jgi:adenylate cyclase class 2
MPIEVEQKFRLLERSAIDARLASLNPSPPTATVQVDCYFAHPNRDFARTDEALRLRREGELNYITYKGPKLDQATKTRREIEVALPAGQPTADETAELLQALGFSRVAEVTKHRVESKVHWQGWEVGVSLDDVVGLGNFVELEIMADQRAVDAARECLASLAAHLGLGNCERRSYLELLLANPNQA